jgi:hypothetical protein
MLNKNRSMFLFVMPSSLEQKVAHGVILLARDIQVIFTQSCVTHGHLASHRIFQSGTPIAERQIDAQSTGGFNGCLRPMTASQKLRINPHSTVGRGGIASQD